MFFHLVVFLQFFPSASSILPLCFAEYMMFLMSAIASYCIATSWLPCSRAGAGWAAQLPLPLASGVLTIMAFTE